MGSPHDGAVEDKRSGTLLRHISTDESASIHENDRTSSAPQKWKTSLYWFVGSGSAVLLANTIFFIWAIRTGGTKDGIGTLHEAPCDNVKNWSILTDLLVNILSSALLAASNYSMQCLSGATRSEIDNAHEVKDWLDIGIPSLRNVVSSHFNERKKVCWWILALSSLPLHLCYNSVVFMSTSAQTYGVFQFGPEAKRAIEDESFYSKLDTSHLSWWRCNLTENCHTYTAGQIYFDAFINDRLKELTLLECINAYSKPLQSQWGNVFLVVEEGFMLPNETFAQYPHIWRTTACSAETSTRWVYEQFLNESGPCMDQEAYRFLPKLQADPSIWTPFNGPPVQRCLSEPTNQKCKLKFSVILAVIVIVFNLVKILTILVGLRQLQDNPMLTIGDAIASFLEKPACSLRNMCLISQAGIHQVGSHWHHLREPRIYEGSGLSWYSAVKKGKRWTIAIVLCTTAVTLTGLLAWAYKSIRGEKDFGSVLHIGLQNIDPRTIVQAGTEDFGLNGLLQNVIIANSPQVIISLVYFTYNATITSMLLAHEWSGFHDQFKSLRVSTGLRGHQKSTYFLQLPYRYAVPLIISSTLLHWLASQSIYVVSVELYNMFGVHNERVFGGVHSERYCWHWSSKYHELDGEPFTEFCGSDFITLSFSPLGILLSLIVVMVMAVGLLLLGQKKLSPAPVVGSCSAAIAASCHTRPDQAPWEKPLKWGVLPDGEHLRHEGTGHCALASHHVEQPRKGALYM